MNADFLYYGGCFVLQTGNINLALTDSIGQAMKAAEEMGVTCNPYWTQYKVQFKDDVDRNIFLKRIETTCGARYLGPFVADVAATHITLAGFCII